MKNENLDALDSESRIYLIWEVAPQDPTLQSSGYRAQPHNEQRDRENVDYILRGFLSLRIGKGRESLIWGQNGKICCFNEVSWFWSYFVCCLFLQPPGVWAWGQERALSGSQEQGQLLFLCRLHIAGFLGLWTPFRILASWWEAGVSGVLN